MSHLDAGKVFLRHSHDGQLRIVHQQRLVQHAAIRAEMLHPVAVTQHHDRIAAGSLVIVVGKNSAECRLHSENLEVITGDQFAHPAFRLSAAGDAGVKREARQHTGAYRAVIAQAFVHRVGEGLRIISIAPHVPLFFAWRAQHHQFFGMLHRQLPQKDLVGQREDGGVGANPQRQRQYRDRAEARIFCQHAQAVTCVLPKRVHL